MRVFVVAKVAASRGKYRNEGRMMMKRRVLGFAACAVVLAMAGTADAQTYGNTDPFDLAAGHAANFVLGVEVVIPTNDFQLESFGMIYGLEGDPLTTSNAIFGLYSSGSNGLPESLIAVTNPINLSARQTYDNIAFTTTPIVQSGTYWMMALYESLSSPRLTELDPNSVVAFWSHSYGAGMPGTASAATYTGQNFNYWVNGTVIPAPGPLAILGLMGGLVAVRRRR